MAAPPNMFPTLLSRMFRPFTTSTATKSLNPEAQAVSEKNIPSNAEKCTVAAGCFWGVEHLFRKHFAGKGLLDARVGYIGDAEALQVTFDPSAVSYTTLLQFFYKMHDPTTLNRQGMDAGTQYRSGIFYHGDEQKRIAEEVTQKANEQWWKGKISTQVLEAGKCE
ncbi:MAG: Peptide methionine sulfoxide reductase [Ramalina farinacea]|uniref:peptide-methionine (S)-S-oxide reductase n=1 Tax=Ramalina farinacea TaxID=258253 RepID=A0AA43QR24_9LECA|nr:Peptide methionine sulfoxide reductase [Ramalina farinacea]